MLGQKNLEALDGHMGAAASDEEEGKGKAEVLFMAGRPRQPLYHFATTGGDHQERTTIRSPRRLSSGNFAAQASRLHEGRKRSIRSFQSDIANERSFTHALAGVELEEVRPNTAQIEPGLQLPWPFLLRLKVNTFAVPLGLSSQAQLWGSLSHSSLVTSALGCAIPNVVQWTFWVLALGLLVGIALGYFCKAALYWGAVKREWAHPIRSNFVFTPFLTSLTLVAAVPRPISQALHPSTSVPLPAFMFLSTLVLYFEMASYGKWLFNQTRSLSRANPSYQLAVVGNFLVARLGTQVSGGRGIEIACGEISLFFFAVGILYLLLVFFAIQHHSANNVVQPSSGTSAATEAPRRATPDPVSTGKGSRGGGMGTAGDTRRQQSLHHDHHNHHDKTVSAAVVAGWGRRPPRFSAGIKEDDGHVPVSAATSSCVLRAGCEELESRDDCTPAGRDIGQRGASNITARTPSVSGSWEGQVSGPSQQHCFSSGLVHQDAVSVSRRVPVGSEVSERRVVPEAAATAPSKAVVARTPAPAGTMTRGAVHERAVLSRALHPIYFLFVAPPSAASIAWKGISGDFDMLAKSLYFIAGFLYVFFVLGNSSFLRTTSFSIAWWAYSFPSSTFAVATIMYAEELSSDGVALVALALALASTLLVLVVFALTVSSALTGTLFGPDPVLSVLLEE